MRNPTDDLELAVDRGIADRAGPDPVDLLYGDHEGGQIASSRANLAPRDDGLWVCSVLFSPDLRPYRPRDLD